MIKAVFFDVDGTLSAPSYLVNGILQVGMPASDWLDFCVHHKKEAYQHCRPVPAVKAYAEKRKAEGASLYVLTTSATSFELRAKEAFIKQHYPGFFTEIISVAADDWKLPVITAVAKDLDIALSECELVEDTLQILFSALEKGIKGTHVSNLYS